MNTEEKAKAYDEALKWMRELYPGLHGATKEDAEHYFPELKESEDERIRKELLEVIRHCYEDGGYALCTDDYKKYSAYLEKQKESQELPLMNGDADLYFDTWRQEVPVPTFRQCFEEGMRYTQRLQKEQKPAEWSEEDVYIATILEHIVGKNRPNEIFKIGNKQGISAYKICSWLKYLPKRLNLQPKEEWSEEDEQRIAEIEFAVMQMNTQRVDTKDKCLAWLKSIRPQSKQEWSKEDEEMRDTCIDLLEHFPRPCGEVIGPWKDCIAWLKSLRPHKNSPIMVDADQLLKILPPPSWKPSKEQLDALRASNSYWKGTTSEVSRIDLLESLHDDLEKLIAKR